MAKFASCFLVLNFIHSCEHLVVRYRFKDWLKLEISSRCKLI